MEVSGNKFIMNDFKNYSCVLYSRQGESLWFKIYKEEL